MTLDIKMFLNIYIINSKLSVSAKDNVGSRRGRGPIAALKLWQSGI